jgi:hypothetical protein
MMQRNACETREVSGRRRVALRAAEGGPDQPLRGPSAALENREAHGLCSSLLLRFSV